MKTDTPPQVRLADYVPFPYRIRQVSLFFRLDPEETTVVSRLEMERASETRAPLRLEGEKLTLLRLLLNGRELENEAYAVDAEGLTVHDTGERFELEIETIIHPMANTELSGLYMSGGRFCTQCEAEGFRRITYYPDRPDVLAPFFVRIEADAVRYPYLLSNGNPGAAGDLPGARHYREWTDPHPKPSYLFALVGGRFDVLEETFVTASGREVRLAIHVEDGDAPRAAYAMDSLRRSMRWDEEVWGREYDLDVFQIVAVRDFNFGAMENKGLNIFNSAYVLADGDSATDADFEAIESIVAHEYFHNWTGNRITCRDWFQLCLKEGLTVYRDQEFSRSMRSAAVTRIKDVIRLRSRQFPEDAGPLAHAVRPTTYGRIDNLYTATVYEKGAELIRMLRLIIGDSAFWQGVQRYFDTQDGQAATIEDFVNSFRPFTSVNLDAFSLWYAQAGTPEVTASGRFEPKEGTYRLRLTQSTGPTPGQPLKAALMIPIRAALFDSNGVKLTTRLKGQTRDDHVLVLGRDEEEFVFSEVSSAPRASLNRGFSAPVRLVDALSEDDRAALAGCDDDPFAQWEALQSIARSLILKPETAGSERLDDYVDAVAVSLSRAAGDPAYGAVLLFTPSVGELIAGMKDADPDALHARRTALRQGLARTLEERLLAVLDLPEEDTFDPSAPAAGQRALRAGALSLLSTLGAIHGDRLSRAFHNARTMTTRLAALTALSNLEGDRFDEALATFEGTWSHSPLVMDKWYGVQAMAVRSDLRSRLVSLAQREDFDRRNPNRVRALAASFAMSNPVAFHKPDGWGYRFLGDMILEIDPLNPALSARLASAFESWRSFDAPRRSAAQTELERLAGRPLSKNALDILGRALAEGPDPAG